MAIPHWSKRELPAGLDHQGSSKRAKRSNENFTKSPSSQKSSSYVESQGLSERPQADIDNFLTTNNVAIQDPLSASLRPIFEFKYLPKLGEDANRLVKAFNTPTAIQAAAWPYLFSRRSCVGIAETGSGKTLAFGLPCIEFVRNQNKKHKHARITAAIVSPTRELAVQVYEELRKLSGADGPRVTCVYGGTSKDDQRVSLRKSHIIVATPGRLNDFIQEGSVDLSKVRYLVLDEADRMLDKGFADEVRKIIFATSQSKRQTLMFTATWPPGIRELAQTYMQDPIRIIIGESITGDLRANDRITQIVEVVKPEEKERKLIDLLTAAANGSRVISEKILVFCLYKKEAVRVERLVRTNGFIVAGIHGDLSQTQRSLSLEQFKSGEVPILVATDVAARGLDIPAVKQVINFTFPLTTEDYVHRIGRTGRAGRRGYSHTLFTEHDKALSGSLINVLKAANQSVPEDLLKFGATVKKKSHSVYGEFYKDVSNETAKGTKITFD